MKRQAREVYGFGARFATRRPLSARAILVIVITAMLTGALWT